MGRAVGATARALPRKAAAAGSKPLGMRGTPWSCPQSSARARAREFVCARVRATCVRDAACALDPAPPLWLWPFGHSWPYRGEG